MIGDVDKLSSHSMVISEKSSHISLSATVHIITDDNVISSFECMKNCGSGSTSAGKSYRSNAILNSRQAVLKSLAGRISSSGVVEVAVELPDVLLGEGGAEMDGNIHAAVDGFRSLTSMDS